MTIRSALPPPRILASIGLFLVLVPCMRGQSTNTQLWVDGIVGRNFGSYFMAECEFSYQRLLRDPDPWVSWNASPTIEASPTAHWSFMAGLPLSWTVQTTELNTFEWRGQLGAKYTFTPFARVITRLNTRLERRNVATSGGDAPDVTTTQRLRLRGEVLVPLDAPRYDRDTVWYALADAEVFIVQGDDVPERFANRTRFRAGLGRKFSYNWRAEAIYTLQTSRDALGDEDPSLDRIIRLRIKYYFTPPGRRSQAGGDNAN